MALTDTIAALAAIKTNIRAAITSKHADPGAHFADYADIINQWWYPSINLTDEMQAGHFCAIISLAAPATVTLRVSQTVDEGGRINWGDGTVEDIAGTGNIDATHAYAKAGTYKPTLIRNQGVVGVRGDALGTNGCISGATSVEFVFIGKDIEIGAYTIIANRGKNGTNIDLTGRTALGDNALMTGDNGPVLSLFGGFSVVTIGNVVCKGAPLESIPGFSPSLSEIPRLAFSECTRLVSISSMPSGLLTIGYGAFSYCYLLNNVRLPDSLTGIGDYAFTDCTRLFSVRCDAVTPPALGSGVFNGCNSLEEIKVPAASVAAYQAATNWSQYASIISAIS